MFDENTLGGSIGDLGNVGGVEIFLFSKSVKSQVYRTQKNYYNNNMIFYRTIFFLFNFYIIFTLTMNLRKVKK